MSEVLDSMHSALASMEDPNEAYEVARRLLESDNKDTYRLSKYHGGVKRHPAHKKILVKPLHGVSAEIGTKIRMIQGLRYAQIPDSKIERALGLYSKWIWTYETKYPEAFMEAKEDIVKLAVEEYHDNVAFARCAVSEMGMKAVETLADIMDDPNARTNERLKAATEVLKLTFGGPPSEGEVAGKVIEKMGDTISKLIVASKSDHTYIYDAEEVHDGTSCSLGP